MPSTPYDAKGLLLESIFDDSPVMFFEHLKLYVAKGPVPEEPYRIPLGVAEVRRAGSDVTSSRSRRWSTGRSQAAERARARRARASR